MKEDTYTPPPPLPKRELPTPEYNTVEDDNKETETQQRLKNEKSVNDAASQLGFMGKALPKNYCRKFREAEESEGKKRKVENHSSDNIPKQNMG